MQKENEIQIRKQHFLREEILEEGFNKDHFSKYLGFYKQNGTNIDVWSEEEIKFIVQKYKNEPVFFFKRSLNEIQENLKIKNMNESDEFQIEVNKEFYRRTFQDFI